LEQLLGGFIGPAFTLGEFGFGGNELATEGLGKNGLRKTIYLPMNDFEASLDPVCK
jgi:hypothetical protein